MDFICDRSNQKYIELGGSNRICTYKLWYPSKTLGMTSFIKVQINYIEHICYPPEKKMVKSVVGLPTPEMRALFLEADRYSTPLFLWAYSIPEILCEKARAILTRMAVKARDFVDIYIIERETGIDIEDHLDCAVNKTRLMLGLYQKYRDNLLGNKRLLESGEIFNWGEERTLLLGDIDDEKLYSFMTQLENQLQKILETIE